MPGLALWYVALLKDLPSGIFLEINHIHLQSALRSSANIQSNQTFKIPPSAEIPNPAQKAAGPGKIGTSGQRPEKTNKSCGNFVFSTPSNGVLI
jgi:hypothetical protein